MRESKIQRHQSTVLVSGESHSSRKRAPQSGPIAFGSCLKEISRWSDWRAASSAVIFSL
jgi:hypothetical protein